MVHALGAHAARRRGSCGFALVEAVATGVMGLAGAAACAVVFQPGDGRAVPQPADPAIVAKARQMKDATQIRGIHQAMVIWAQSNQDKFPLPSEIDKKGSTQAGPDASKDTTANIMSLLVFNGFIPPEMLVGPAESNQNIKVVENYQYSNPTRAVRPAEALWDPALSADFTGGKTGNVSYAHLQPVAKRREQWMNTFSAMYPQVGNRGPRIDGVEPDVQSTNPLARWVKAAPGMSNTYAIHGQPQTWEGNIGYADSHVEFLTSLGPPADATPLTWLSFRSREDNTKQILDVYFYDEPEDRETGNAYLGIFTKSGSQKPEWQSIWD